MIASLAARIQAIDRETLTPIAQQAAGVSGSLTHWVAAQFKAFKGGFGTNVIYRFTGGIRGEAGETPWSMFLKVKSAALPGIGPQFRGPDEYRREFEFYRSGLNQRFPAGFRTARCYASSEQVNEDGQPEVWLWLEDLSLYAASEWSLKDNCEAAFALGKFSGVFLVDQPLPTQPWLKPDYVRKYLEAIEPFFQRLFEQRDQPLVRRAFPPAEVDSLVELWQNREKHLEFLERLPKSLCHNDAQFTNLFLVRGTAGTAEMAVIDWEYVGVAQVGLDLAQLLVTSYWTDEAAFRGLVNAIFQRYIDGLRAVGWQGDVRLIRLSFTSAMLKLKGTLVLRLMEIFAGEKNNPRRDLLLEEKKMTLEELADSIAWVHGFTRRLWEESLELRQQPG